MIPSFLALLLRTFLKPRFVLETWLVMLMVLSIARRQRICLRSFKRLGVSGMSTMASSEPMVLGTDGLMLAEAGHSLRMFLFFVRLFADRIRRKDVKRWVGEEGQDCTLVELPTVSAPVSV